MAAVTVSTDAVSGNLMPDTFQAGVLMCRSAKYTATAALDANSVIKMVPVPAGARITRIDYMTTALGASRTLDIGNADTIDAYVDGDDVSSAVADSVVLDTILAADIDVQFKILGDTLPDEAVLSCHVYYKMADNISDEG